MAEPGAPDPWSSFAHDPRDPALAGLRASDADREVVQRVLADAFADGRLDREEHDDRSSVVLGARTLGELRPLMADLVPDRPLLSPGRAPLVSASPGDIAQRAQEHWRKERREALGTFVFASIVCWVIWLATSFGDGSFEPYFAWPAIVSAATLANVLRVGITRNEIINSETLRLERKQARDRAKGAQDRERKQRGGS